MKILFLLILILCNFSFIYSLENVFDKVTWEKVNENDGIELFLQNEKNSRVTFYKAVKKVNDVKINDVFNALMDFEKYPKIFSKITKFEKKDIIDNDKFTAYFIIDFSPLKSRDYYVDFNYNIVKSSDGKTKYIIEWSPVQKNFEENKNYKRVKNINGRWILEGTKDNNVLISVEYYNDFEVYAVKSIIQGFEKKSTVNAIKDLLKYVHKMYL